MNPSASQAAIEGQAKKTAGRTPLLDYLSLFSSLGTLLCCALPSLLVLLGLGATVASFVSAVPWLVTLARHKVWVFSIAGTLIVADFLYIYGMAPRLKAQSQVCSVKDGASACDRARRFSHIALWVAAAIYAVGFFTAYLLAPTLIRLSSR